MRLSLCRPASLASIRRQLLFFASMRRGKPASEPAGNERSANAAKESPLSLARLRDAFAAMLGDRGNSQSAPEREQEAGTDQASRLPAHRHLPPTPCEINPRTVVEAMLF